MISHSSSFDTVLDQIMYERRQYTKSQARNFFHLNFNELSQMAHSISNLNISEFPYVENNLMLAMYVSISVEQFRFTVKTNCDST